MPKIANVSQCYSSCDCSTCSLSGRWVHVVLHDGGETEAKGRRQINIGKVVQLKPSSARVEAWYKQTGTPFNPFEAMTVTASKFKQLECPRCRTMAYVRECTLSVGDLI